MEETYRSHHFPYCCNSKSHSQPKSLINLVISTVFWFLRQVCNDAKNGFIQVSLMMNLQIEMVAMASGFLLLHTYIHPFVNYRFSCLVLGTTKSDCVVMDSTRWIPFLRPLLLFFHLFLSVSHVESVGTTNSAGGLYRGKYIGRLSARQHKVSGEVYAVDGRTIYIRGFTYDGTGPDAFFWTGFTEHPSPQGIIVPNEKGSKAVLGGYNNQDVTITLPDGLSLKDIKWFAVWCRAYEVNFGDLYIPAELEYPQPHVIGSLSGQHGVSSGPIVVVDAQTILVPDFTYDGQAPDVHFWVGKGKPGTDGTRVADETGGDTTTLVKSDKKTMVLSLPGDLTIFDIDYFGVWCRLYYVDFGHVRIPQNINVPPSLKMLGVTPQTKLNCEVLYDRLALEVRWAVAGDSIVIQLVGRIEDGQYISFGLSGDESRSVMIGGDVVIGWFDRTSGRGNVVDYYLDSKAQCSGRTGVCPDSRLKAEANNVRLLSGGVVNGFTMLTFQRPLKAHDELDKTITTNGSQSVIWGVGPINQRNEASYHSLRNRDDIFIDFGRVPKWNCPAPDTESLTSSTGSTTLNPDNLPSKPVGLSYQPDQRPIDTGLSNPATISKESVPDLKVMISSAWRVPPILCHEPEDRVFYAQMGPTGGKRGYSAITDKIGWGIAWYINGLLVPEVYLVRGKTYTFVLEGGDNPEIPAKYHPFYITDDPEGGYQHKTPAEKKKVKIFAGQGGTGTGRLCHWQENVNLPADSFASYGAYQRSLNLQCDDGHPGILHWTPDSNTPDIVYYQCFTHRYLGWKIHIVDSCEGDEYGDGVPSQQLQSRIGEQGIGESIPNRRDNQAISTKTGGTNNGSDTIYSTERTPIDTISINKFNPTVGPADPPILLDRTQLHGKQDLTSPTIGQHFINRQDVQNPPPPQPVVHYSQNPFLQIPQPQPLTLNFPNNPQTFTKQQYPSETQFTRKDSQPTQFQIIDSYSRPSGTSDYYIGSTRPPIMAYPIRYDNQRPMASETVKFIVPSTEGSRPRSSLWSGQSRNLPKREEIQRGRDNYENYQNFQRINSHYEDSGMIPMRKSEDSEEIIKINDRDRLGFELESRLSGFTGSGQEIRKVPVEPSSSYQFSPSVLFTDQRKPKLSNEPTKDMENEGVLDLHKLTYDQLPPKLPHHAVERVYQSQKQTQSYSLKKKEMDPERFIEIKSLPTYGASVLGNPPTVRHHYSNSQPTNPIQQYNLRSNTQRQIVSVGRSKSKDLEIISTDDDLERVYPRNTIDKGVRRDVPRIFGYVGNQVVLTNEENAPGNQEMRIFRTSSTNNNKVIGQQNLIPKAHNNHSDLHILTDIWSIINNREELNTSGTKQSQVHPRLSHLKSRALEFQSNSKEMIHLDPRSPGRSEESDRVTYPVSPSPPNHHHSNLPLRTGSQ